MTRAIVIDPEASECLMKCPLLDSLDFFADTQSIDMSLKSNQTDAESEKIGGNLP